MRTSARSLLRRFGVLAALAAGLAFATPASAGTYTAGWCSLNSGSDVTASTNTSSTGGGLYWWTLNNCDSDYYARFENGTVPNGSSYDFTWGAPADTYISAVSWTADATVRNAGAGAGIYATRGDNTTQTLTAIADSGSFSNGSANLSPASAVKSVRTSLFCSNSAGCPFNGSSYGAEIYFHGWQMTLTDPYSPTFQSTGGSGWTATPADSASDVVTYSLADRGAGVRSVALFVDGTKKATNTIACSRADVPCPLTNSGQFTLDTTQLAEGDHTVQMTVADFSGNTTDATQTVTVRRAPAVVAPGPGDPAGSNSNAPSVGGYTDPFTQGETATGDRGNWTGSGISYSYQWRRCDANGVSCSDIPGATNLTYTAAQGDVGHTLVFCVTASSTGGTTTACSPPSAVVEADRDGDGVPDVLDHCPSTAEATSDGCPATDAGTSTSVGTNATPQTSRSTPTSTDGAGAQSGANGTAGGAGSTVTALVNNKYRVQKVRFGKRVAISGRLIGPSGAPVADAVIEVLEQVATPGAKLVEKARVVSGRDGRFTYIAPAGPSRLIRFGYRADTGDSSFVDTTDVKLLVAAAAKLTATPKKLRNGQATVFRGALLGKGVPRTGVIIDLQAKVGKRWRSFGLARARAARKGAFKYTYRFTRTHGRQTYTFRARVRKDSSFAYEVGYSKAIKVTVIG